jgi:phage terminase large subunit
MGGGKSRTLCQDKFREMLEYPGIKVVLARAQHTSIIETTKKTMLEQVIPAQLLSNSKQSGGEDYIRLWNGSVCHFIGLDDPLRWYSSEIGSIAFDEAQEIEEEKAIRLITRLRQQGMPCRATFGFNPSNPGHWLQNWFYIGGERTEHGFYKKELYATSASRPIGEAEFIFAKATDNVYLPEGYVDQTLMGLPDHLRRRYLDGLWEYITGNAFFDQDALQYYTELAGETKSVQATPIGDIAQDINQRTRNKKSSDPIRAKVGQGPLQVFKPPVKGEKPHRYVIGVDSSSGRGEDWTAMQVVDIDDFDQAAELQIKLPPNEAAEWAYRLGRIYNDAKIVCEVTGGWGFAVDQRLREMKYPNPYTRRVVDRLTKRFTDKLGFDTTQKSRPLILSALEEAVRQREFGLYGMRTLAELSAFVWSDRGKAEAQPGAHDDLVMSLALAVWVRSTEPLRRERLKVKQYEPSLSVTGY